VNRINGIQITELQNNSLSNNRVYAAGSWYRSRVPSEVSGFQFDHEFDQEALFLITSDDFGDSWTFSFSEEFSE
jgi:hypothetical protein